MGVLRLKVLKCRPSFGSGGCQNDVLDAVGAFIEAIRALLTRDFSLRYLEYICSRSIFQDEDPTRAVKTFPVRYLSALFCLLSLQECCLQRIGA